MRRQRLDVDRYQSVGCGEPLQRNKREVREVLVIDRVELVLGDQALEMRNLDGDDALRRQEKRHAGDEVVELAELAPSTLLAAIKSAWPCSATISRAVSVLKKAVRVGMPLARAVSATLAAGSIPSTR